MINKCPKCNKELEFLSGRPAIYNNMYCKDEKCGWKAWERKSNIPEHIKRIDDYLDDFHVS